VLTPRVLLIDTSKIRICAKGQVDFTQKHIRLAAVPRPKKPEFFSLATPLAVNGTFSDFGVGIDSGGLIGTAIRFATSPVMTPLLRLAGKGLPADGADVCSMSIGPDSRQGEPETGCN
jgi:AsmA family protein